LHFTPTLFGDVKQVKKAYEISIAHFARWRSVSERTTREIALLEKVIVTGVYFPEKEVTICFSV
jgi:hypothetical protein